MLLHGKFHFNNSLSVMNSRAKVWPETLSLFANLRPNFWADATRQSESTEETVQRDS